MSKALDQLYAAAVRFGVDPTTGHALSDPPQRRLVTGTNGSSGGTGTGPADGPPGGTGTGPADGPPGGTGTGPADGPPGGTGEVAWSDGPQGGSRQDTSAAPLIPQRRPGYAAFMATVPDEALADCVQESIRRGAAFHGERIAARKAANRPWDKDGN